MIQSNDGVIMTGNITHSSIAIAGKNGAVNQKIQQGDFNDKQAFVKAAIDKLINEVNANEKLISNPEEMIGAIHQLEEEVQKEKPNRYTLKGLLDGVTSGLGSATGAVNAVTMLRQAISVLLGLPSIC